MRYSTTSCITGEKTVPANRRCRVTLCAHWYGHCATDTRSGTRRTRRCTRASACSHHFSACRSAPFPQRRGSRSWGAAKRPEEHTSELKSLLRTSYAVYCFEKNKLLYKQQHKCKTTK